MKNTILFSACLLLALSAFSQDSTNHKMHNGSMHNKSMMHGNMKDCIMMQDGTPMVMKEGQTMPLSQQMTLPNGTVVMTDGTVKMKNGATKMMKNGDCIYMDGTMGKMPMHDKMKMKKDSTMM